MAEKEYIECEPIIQFIEHGLNEKKFGYDAIEILGEINYAPAADAVEVIRCKDCKWYKESKLLAPDKFCFRLKDGNGNHVGYNFVPNDFCSHGERKDGDTDANSNDNKTPET